jgi:hypothetical protein
MLLGTPKYGIGSFSKREDVQAAIETLQNSDFPMKQVTIVMQEVESKDEDIAISKDEFIDSKATSGVTKGALTAGTIGGISGVLMGLGALMLPGIGSIAVIGVKSALVGMATGGFYGTTAGTLMGAALGDDISQDQAKQYSDRLAQGNYLMIIEGPEDEIHRAEAILKTEAVNDWGIY